MVKNFEDNINISKNISVFSSTNNRVKKNKNTMMLIKVLEENKWINLKTEVIVLLEKSSIGRSEVLCKKVANKILKAQENNTDKYESDLYTSIMDYFEFFGAGSMNLIMNFMEDDSLYENDKVSRKKIARFIDWLVKLGLVDYKVIEPSKELNIFGTPTRFYFRVGLDEDTYNEYWKEALAVYKHKPLSMGNNTTLSQQQAFIESGLKTPEDFERTKKPEPLTDKEKRIQKQQEEYQQQKDAGNRSISTCVECSKLYKAPSTNAIIRHEGYTYNGFIRVKDGKNKLVCFTCFKNIINLLIQDIGGMQHERQTVA